MKTPMTESERQIEIVKAVEGIKKFLDDNGTYTELLEVYANGSSEVLDLVSQMSQSTDTYFGNVSAAMYLMNGMLKAIKPFALIYE